MVMTDIVRDVRGFCLTSVRFAPETEGSRRQARQAERMNRFYGELEKTAEAYAVACLEICPLSRYICTIRAYEEAGRIDMTVTLTHRMPGEMSRRKCVLHRWRGGILREEKYL